MGGFRGDNGRSTETSRIGGVVPRICRKDRQSGHLGIAAAHGRGSRTRGGSARAASARSRRDIARPRISPVASTAAQAAVSRDSFKNGGAEGDRTPRFAKLRETACGIVIAIMFFKFIEFRPHPSCKPVRPVPYCFVELEPMWNLSYAGETCKPAA